MTDPFKEAIIAAARVLFNDAQLTLNDQAEFIVGDTLRGHLHASAEDRDTYQICDKHGSGIVELRFFSKGA